MVIVCSTDDKFVQHCTIMLVSLLSNNKNVEIYILTEYLTLKSIKILEDEVSQYNGKLHLMNINSSVIDKFPMPKGSNLSHISRATYYRLLIPDILPDSIDKILYLDCDIIVNASIDNLWNVNLEGYAIAAVKQIGYGFEAERLRYPIKYGYFNAGVILMNLTFCRENRITEQFIKYISDNYSKILYHDQDTMNAVLYDRCLSLLPQWNMTSIVYDFDLKRRGDSRKGLIINNYDAEKANAIKYRNNPIILHYVSKPKPWDNNCVHSMYHLYFYYANKTLHFNNLNCQNKISRGFAIIIYILKSMSSSIKQRLKKTDGTRL